MTNKTKKPEWEDEFDREANEIYDMLFPRPAFEQRIKYFKEFIRDIEKDAIAQTRQSTIDEVIGVLEENVNNFEDLTKKAYKDGSVEYFTYSMQAKMYRGVLKLIQSLSKTGGKL